MEILETCPRVRRARATERGREVEREVLVMLQQKYARSEVDTGESLKIKTEGVGGAGECLKGATTQRHD